MANCYGLGAELNAKVELNHDNGPTATKFLMKCPSEDDTQINVRFGSYAELLALAKKFRPQLKDFSLLYNNHKGYETAIVSENCVKSLLLYRQAITILIIPAKEVTSQGCCWSYGFFFGVDLIDCACLKAYTYFNMFRALVLCNLVIIFFFT